MASIFNKFFLILFLGIAQLLSSQNNNATMSDAVLKVDGQDRPTKIFATQNPIYFSNNALQKEEVTQLVIVNTDNKTPYSDENLNYILSVFQGYKNNGYQFLDDNLQPTEQTLNPEEIVSVKYLYKPTNPQQIINYGQSVSLDTTYTIWDPIKGFNIGPFTLHLYSLMFIFAFGIGFFLMKKMFKIDGENEKFLEPLFTWTLLGTIFGARIGHVLFYQPELFQQDFLSVFLPISTVGGLKFTGFAGLASHGAAIALIATTLYYSIKIIKKNPFWVYDRLVIVVALAGFFIRMGNFFNSEIIGKAINPTSPLAVLFPQQSSEYGLTIARYPAQFIEAICYLILFVILWAIYLKTDKKYQQGWIFGFFFFVLWSIRFLVEFLKEPQGQEVISFAGLNTGQILSLPFMVGGLIMMFYSKKMKISKA